MWKGESLELSIENPFALGDNDFIHFPETFIRLNHNFCYTFSFFLGKTVEASGIFGRGGYIKRVKRTTH